MAQTGRPPIPKHQQRIERIPIRVSKSEKRRIEASAADKGQPVSRYARETLLAADSAREAKAS